MENIRKSLPDQKITTNLQSQVEKFDDKNVSNETLPIAGKIIQIFSDYSIPPPDSESKSLRSSDSFESSQGISSAQESLKNIGQALQSHGLSKASNRIRPRSIARDSLELQKKIPNPEMKTPYGLGQLGKNSNELIDKYESKVNAFIQEKLNSDKPSDFHKLADVYIRENNQSISKKEAYNDPEVINFVKMAVKANPVEHKQVFNQIMDKILIHSGRKLEFTAASFNAAAKFDENSDLVTAFIKNRLLGEPKNGQVNEYRKIADDFIKKNKIPNTNSEAYLDSKVINHVKNVALNQKDTHYKMHHDILNYILVETNTTIGTVYKFAENKRWGVEPGFEATKIWTQNHTDKINNPEHKYYAVANSFIEEHFKEKIQDLKSNKPHLNDQESIDLLKSDGTVLKSLQEHFYKNFKTFQKLHFVKLDYANPVLGVVSIDAGRAIPTEGRLRREGFDGLADIVKKMEFVNNIARDMHVSAVAETPREKNLGAIKEALANDIFEVFGFGGQKLKLIQAQYDDGSSKLLLDGTMVEGPNREKFSTLKGQIKNGRLENNGITENGIFYPIDPKELARAKLMTLLMGDRDKIGSEGGNLGYIVIDGKAKLMNIDPGKSLEGIPEPGKTDVMTQKNLHTDISFDQPPEKFKYKNLGIFDDTLLSDKMEGMRTIINSKAEVENIFKAYEDAFDRPGEDLNFKKEITKIKMRLFDRIDYFEGVLKERVNLMNFDKDLGPKALDCLDNIEKAFSETIDHVGEGKDKIVFQHLEVKPGTRKEFHLVKDEQGEGFTLSFHGKVPSESVAMQRNFNRYGSEESNVPTFNGELKGNAFKIKIANKDELNKFIDFFEEAKVAKRKKASRATFPF